MIFKSNLDSLQLRINEVQIIMLHLAKKDKEKGMVRVTQSKRVSFLLLKQCLDKILEECKEDGF